MAAAHTGRADARLQVVEEHVRRENEHDLEGVLATFGETPVYEEEAWGERYQGMAGVRRYYEALLAAVPDLHIDIRRRHATEDAIVLEVTICGTHRGFWRGLPPTGRRLEFPLCAVYTFTPDDRLAGERIYYDRALVLRQLGVYREPVTPAGRLAMALGHPVTLLRAWGRWLARRRGRP